MTVGRNGLYLLAIQCVRASFSFARPQRPKAARTESQFMPLLSLTVWFMPHCMEQKHPSLVKVKIKHPASVWPCRTNSGGCHRFMTFELPLNLLRIIQARYSGISRNIMWDEFRISVNSLMVISQRPPCWQFLIFSRIASGIELSKYEKS
jgi:hypothetical protein